MFINGNRVRVLTNEFDSTGVEVGDEGMVHIFDGHTVWVYLDKHDIHFPFFPNELEHVY